MTPQEAFRFGFLLRCADEGLTAEQTGDRVKHAIWYPSPVRTARLFATLALLGLVGAGAVGAAGGHGAGKLMEQEIDPEIAKRQELAATYQQQAQRLRRLHQQRYYRDAATPAAPRPARIP